MGRQVGCTGLVRIGELLGKDREEEEKEEEEEEEGEERDDNR